MKFVAVCCLGCVAADHWHADWLNKSQTTWNALVGKSQSIVSKDVPGLTADVWGRISKAGVSGLDKVKSLSILKPLRDRLPQSGDDSPGEEREVKEQSPPPELIVPNDDSKSPVLPALRETVPATHEVEPTHKVEPPRPKLEPPKSSPKSKSEPKLELPVNPVSKLLNKNGIAVSNAASDEKALIAEKGQRHTLPDATLLKTMHCVPEISLNSCFQNCYDTVVPNATSDGKGVTSWEFSELHKCLTSVCVANYVLSPIPGCIGSNGKVADTPPSVDPKALDFHDPSKLDVWKDWRLFGLRRAWHNLSESNLFLRSLTLIITTVMTAGIPVLVMYLLLPAMTSVINGDAAKHVKCPGVLCGDSNDADNNRTMFNACSAALNDDWKSVRNSSLLTQAFGHAVEYFSFAAHHATNLINRGCDEGTSRLFGADISYAAVPKQDHDIKLSDEVSLSNGRFSRA